MQAILDEISIQSFEIFWPTHISVIFTATGLISSSAVVYVASWFCQLTSMLIQDAVH